MDLRDNARASPEPKRRKVRRGTRSCWECKRRKVRCIFTSSLDTVCAACRRRETTCIDQEHPEEESRAKNQIDPGKDQMVRVEALLKRLVGDVGDETTAEGAPTTLDRCRNVLVGGLHTPASEAGRSNAPTTLETASPGSEPAPAPAPAAHQAQIHSKTMTSYAAVRRHLKLSEALHAALPSQHDLDILYKAERETPIYFHEANLRSYLELERDGFQHPGEVPSAQAHPVLVARRMLVLALFLMNVMRRERLKLSEPPCILMNRLADTAIRLVVSNDELAGTMEHLECHMITGIYHWGRGGIRQAWISWRKALLFAQCLGIHRPGAATPKTLTPGTKYNPQVVWFRIVYMDRFLSMILRLPQGTPDVNLGCEATFASDTPNRRLERVQAIIAARILERNERDPALLDQSATRDIDAEMLKAAKSMPPAFWAPPNFSNGNVQSEEGFWKTVRMVDQVFHYTLLIMLHLPYLLRFDDDPGHEYSRLTCLNAGRDSMLRYISFRNSNVAWYCRPADFFALVASITVVLAHLGSHRHERMASTLAHQRFGDRDVVEQVLNKMAMSGKITDDAMLTKSADLLSRLLQVEESASQGHWYRTQMVEAAEVQKEDEQTVLQISLPYFGLIRITREDATLGGSPGGPPRTAMNSSAEIRAAKRADLISAVEQGHAADKGRCMDCASPSGHINISSQVGLGQQSQDLHPLLSPKGSNEPLPGEVETSNSFGEPYSASGLAGNEQDCAFTGIDTAFFEDLLNNTGLGGGAGENDSCSMVYDWVWLPDMQ